MPWYVFTPPNTWTLVAGTPPVCLGPNNQICAIQAADNSGQPIITEALTDEILRALQNRIDTTNVSLKP